jgi:hypothetical protein
MPDVDEPDDALLDDVGQVLDAADATVRALGLSVAMQTASAILAVAVLPTDASADTARRHEVVEAAKALAAKLVRRPRADPRLSLRMAVNADDAVVREGPQGVSPESGALLQVDAWATHPVGDGLEVTDSALAPLGA